MSGHWTLLLYKISNYVSHNFGVQTEEQERQEEELEKWTFCHISHVSSQILTKQLILIDLSYHCGVKSGLSLKENF